MGIGNPLRSQGGQGSADSLDETIRTPVIYYGLIGFRAVNVLHDNATIAIPVYKFRLSYDAA
jgi:hypothetical protein